MDLDTLLSSFTGLAPAHLAGALAVFLLAGLVKGVVGLGLPTVAMALLALWMSPAQAAALLIVPSLLTNVWQLGPLATLWPLARRLGGMLAGILAGTALGAWLLGEPAGAGARMALGGVLVAYAAWGLVGARLHVPARSERIAGPVVGAVTGFVTAATGVFVVPAVPYMQALGLGRDAMIQAMGLSFTVSTLALMGALAYNGVQPGSVAGLSLLMLLPAVAGMAIGQRLRSRLSPEAFRRCLLGSVLVLGCYMLLKEALA